MSQPLLSLWLLATTLLLGLSWLPAAPRLLRLERLTPWRVGAVALVARLVPALLLRLPAGTLVQWDITSYQIVARLLLAGRDIYTSGRYPYLPLQVYALAAAEWLHGQTALPFLPLVKAPSILADAATAAILLRAASRRGRSALAAGRVALLFALNPISITITSLHGQFDALPLCFAAGAWALLDADRAGIAGDETAELAGGCSRSSASDCLPAQHRSTAPLWAGLLVGLGIAEKSWPALLLPALLLLPRTWRARAVFVAATLLPIAACLALYAALMRVSPWHPLFVALSYRAYTGAWGVSLLLEKLALIWPRALPLARLFDRHGGLLDLGITALAGVVLVRRDAALACLALLLVAFAAASGWGYHWLVWPLPFAALAAERPARLYTLLGALQYLWIYFFFGGVAWGFARFTDSLSILRYTWLLSLPLWLFVVAWALQSLRLSPEH